MPFRVTNISNELMKSDINFNKNVEINGNIILPAQSIFFLWDFVPTHVNILKLKNLINVESVSNNDLGVIIQHENKLEELKNTRIEVKKTEPEEIVEEQINDSEDNSLQEKTPEKPKKKKKTE